MVKLYREPPLKLYRIMPQARPEYALKRRGLSWSVRVYVPRRLWAAVGKREIVEALGTRDEREANRRAMARYLSIRSQWSRLPASVPIVQRPASDPATIVDTARALRERIAAGEISAGDEVVTHDDGSISVHNYVDDMLDLAIEAHRDSYSGVDPYSDWPSETHPELGPSLDLARRMVSDPDYRPLSEWVDAYIADKAHLVPATLEAKRRDLGRLAAWAGSFTDPRTIDRRRAVAFVQQQVKMRDCAPKTKIDELKNLTAFFSWLEHNAVIPSNPFKRTSAMIEVSSRGEEGPRREWTQDELAVLLSAPFPRHDLSAVVLIGLYSGARLEEICQLKTNDIEADFLCIRSGKNASAVRRVPIHAALAPLVRTLSATSHDGYLITGIAQMKSKRPRKRSESLSKDFGRWCDNIGLTDSRICFHTLRNTVIASMERAGVPEPTAKLVVGHTRGSMTYGTYSRGPGEAVLRDAVGKISHGEKVDVLAAAVVAEHKGNPAPGTFKPRALGRNPGAGGTVTRDKR